MNFVEVEVNVLLILLFALMCMCLIAAISSSGKEKIAKEANECGFTDITMTETFEEAVMKSVEFAEPGDAVLLSPACASWGMFKNYEERGDKFKEIVNSL